MPGRILLDTNIVIALFAGEKPVCERLVEFASRCGRVCASCGSIGGPGYRVYYAMLGRGCVLLLCGGDKRKQSSDIDRALEYLKDYKERSETS